MNSIDIFIACGAILFMILALQRYAGLNWEALGVIVITLSLVVSAINTYETKRIANQTQEDSLRPLILRQGVLINWNIQSTQQLAGLVNGDEIKLLEFINHKNIAANLSGTLVLNGKKYSLLFTNGIAQKTVGTVTEIGVFKTWAWLPENGLIQATYNSEIFTEVTGENEIRLEYQDIHGNRYYTKEDAMNVQTSYPIKK